VALDLEADDPRFDAFGYEAFGPRRFVRPSEGCDCVSDGVGHGEPLGAHHRRQVVGQLLIDAYGRA